MSKEENPPKYAYATDLIQEVMVKASQYFRVRSIEFKASKMVSFHYYTDDQEGRIETKLFTSFKDFIIFLESLETYKVGDWIKCGNVTYLIYYNRGETFLINLNLGFNYGKGIIHSKTKQLSRSEVEEMFDYHSRVEFTKVNKSL